VEIVDNKLIMFSECKFALLCQKGTKYVDARLCFEGEDGKKVLLLLQMRHTASTKYLETKNLKIILSNLTPYYPSYKIIVGAISNRPLAAVEKEKMKNRNENIFIISKDEVSLFVPTLFHRFVNTFERKFVQLQPKTTKSPIPTNKDIEDRAVNEGNVGSEIDGVGAKKGA